MTPWRPSPRSGVRVFGPVISLLARTWRFDLDAESRWKSVQDGGKPFLFLLWHEALLPLLWRHRRQGIAIVVSANLDGQYLAEYARRMGYGFVFGSSGPTGARALLQSVRTLQAGTPVAFTPDGPRGPRRVVKPGALMAAQRGGALVLPIHADANRAWRLTGWDRFMVPKPFARVRIGYGEPFPVPPGDTALEAAVMQAAMALRSVEERIAWPPAAAMATA